jgi:hypothetical protein
MFQKGQSGNPAGRPKKGQALTDILRKELNKRTIYDEDQKTYIARKTAIIRKMIDLAIEGDLAAQKYIFDRVDGKPMESMELTGQNGGPLAFVELLEAAHKRRKEAEENLDGDEEDTEGGEAS